MVLRQLEYFLAVYEEGSFTRAAERLHIAQPPLSRAIRNLETDLGVSLFERSGRVIEPTAAADVLAVEARKIMVAVSNARAEVAHAMHSVVELRIGTVPTVPFTWINELLARFGDSEPRLRIDVVHLSSAEQVVALRRGDLDVGIVYGEPGSDEDDAFEVARVTARNEPLVAVLPLAHPLAEKETIGPDDVADVALVSIPRRSNPPLVDGYLRRIEAAGFRFRELVTVNGQHPRDVILAVAAGRGIALAPKSAVETLGVSSSVTFRGLDPQVDAPPVVLVWRRDSSSLVSSAVDLIRAQAPAA